MKHSIFWIKSKRMNYLFYKISLFLFLTLKILLNKVKVFFNNTELFVQEGKVIRVAFTVFGDFSQESLSRQAVIVDFFV